MLRALLLALLAVAVGGIGLAMRFAQGDGTDVSGTTAVTVGRKPLMVEKAMMRDPALRAGGAITRLDLVLTWPDLRGAGASAAVTGENLVFVAVEDSDLRKTLPGEIDAIEQPVTLYSRFLERDAWQNPGGLIMRRFRAGTPYDGEELYLSAPDERHFAARCPRQNVQSGMPEDLCLWQLRQNGLEAQVRFPARYLVNWDHLAASVRALLTRLQAGKS